MSYENTFIKSLKTKNKINSDDFFEIIMLSNNNSSRSKIENAINSSGSLRLAYKDFLKKELKNISNLNRNNKQKYKKKVYIGPKGGKYVLVNGKKKYI
jgi:hypothetical protein